MRKTLRASALVLFLCAPAFAGDIPNPSTTEPPPPPSTTAEEPAAEGMQNGMIETFTETVLSALESVLALL